MAPAPLDQKMRGEVRELSQMLKSNLQKVVQHGKRADSIVKNMLLHSREGSGERRSADINALGGRELQPRLSRCTGRAARLCHRAQARPRPTRAQLELYPQEITRALLNLISNGFYAATRRKAEKGDGAFEPMLVRPHQEPRRYGRNPDSRQRQRYPA